MLLKWGKKEIKEKKNIAYSKLQAYKKSGKDFHKILKNRKQLSYSWTNYLLLRKKSIWIFNCSRKSTKKIHKTLGTGTLCSLYYFL